MAGNFAAAFGPAALRFLRPILVVGCGGGSYLGFSFYRAINHQSFGATNNNTHGISPSYPYHLYRLLLDRHRRDRIVDFPRCLVSYTVVKYHRGMQLLPS